MGRGSSDVRACLPAVASGTVDLARRALAAIATAGIRLSDPLGPVVERFVLLASDRFLDGDQARLRHVATGLASLEDLLAQVARMPFIEHAFVAAWDLGDGRTPARRLDVELVVLLEVEATPTPGDPELRALRAQTFYGWGPSYDGAHPGRGMLLLGGPGSPRPAGYAYPRWLRVGTVAHGSAPRLAQGLLHAQAGTLTIDAAYYLYRTDRLLALIDLDAGRSIPLTMRASADGLHADAPYLQRATSGVTTYPTYTEAEALAALAHAGQVDKAGAPYIEHLRRVAARCGSERARIVGVLHDLIEDTPWTFEMLTAAGYCEDVLRPLRSLTRDRSRTYAQYIAELKVDPLAVEVKIADLADKLDPIHVAALGPGGASLVRRYRRAWVELTGHAYPAR